MCWRPARRTRCASSSNGPSPQIGVEIDWRGAGRRGSRRRRRERPRAGRGRPALFPPDRGRPPDRRRRARRRRSSAGGTRPTSRELVAEMVRRGPESSVPNAKQRRNAELKASRFRSKGKRVWVAGHRGMVGSALVRRLAREDCEILTVDRATLDLRAPGPTSRPGSPTPGRTRSSWPPPRSAASSPTTRYPAEFLYDNLMIQTNVIEARAPGRRRPSCCSSARPASIRKLAPQPIAEEALLTGPLEPTNEWYAIAKIAGLKLCQAYRRQYGCDFISAMPTNLYGPGDNFDLATSPRPAGADPQGARGQGRRASGR